MSLLKPSGWIMSIGTLYGVHTGIAKSQSKNPHKDFFKVYCPVADLCGDIVTINLNHIDSGPIYRTIYPIHFD